MAVGSGQALWFLVLALLGVAVVVFAEWRYAVGVRLSPAGALELTRVHPAFRAAVMELVEQRR